MDREQPGRNHHQAEPDVRRARRAAERPQPDRQADRPTLHLSLIHI